MALYLEKLLSTSQDVTPLQEEEEEEEEEGEKELLKVVFCIRSAPRYKRRTRN
jgi:hypothetical protein